MTYMPMTLMFNTVETSFANCNSVETAFATQWKLVLQHIGNCLCNSVWKLGYSWNLKAMELCKCAWYLYSCKLQLQYMSDYVIFLVHCICTPPSLWNGGGSNNSPPSNFRNGLPLKCFKDDLQLFLRLIAGFRIRILSGSGLNQVSGSGSAFRIRIRIQKGKNYPQE